MIREEHLAVTRSARFATLGEPAAGDLEEIWFVCHGYRQLAAPFLRNFRSLDNGRRLIVAPEALNRFYLDDDGGPHGPESRVGATWMTREDRESEIADYVACLDSLYSHVLNRADASHPPAPLNESATASEPPGALNERSFSSGRDVRIRVLGYSQGAATASRWAAYGQARIDQLILWAGLPAHDLELTGAADRLAGMDVTLVAGSEDGYTNPARAAGEVERLNAAEIPARLLEFDGGHRLDRATLDRLAGE